MSLVLLSSSRCRLTAKVPNVRRLAGSVRNAAVLKTRIVKSLNQKIVTGGDKLGHPLYN